ncbi:MAG: SBBP repeat-containing protein, partial [Sphingobacteriaceae bacterium]
MSVYITEKGLTYVFTKTETQIEGENASEKQELTNQQQVNGNRYKTEMAWVNVILKNATINRDNIIKEGRSEEHFNYFYGHCPDGLNNVFEYDKITIKNIYPNIDWVIYNSTKNGFKYDFIVHPGADPGLIKLIYDSEKPLDVDSQGNISIITPLGTLTEQAPYSYLLNSKKEVKSSFRRRQINSHQVEISFGLFNDYDDQNETGSFGNETLIIDPQMVWGTYYGSNTATNTGPGDGTEMRGVDNDASGKLFATGHTCNSFFPTFNPLGGAYFQSVFGNTSNVTDIFILKFSNSGQLLWATYYGGNNVDYATSIKVDGFNNVFLTGCTFSTNFPLCSTCPGYFSNVNPFAQVIFLKFDNSGVRQWATLFGGTIGFDFPFGTSLAFDSFNNLIAVGLTINSNFPMFGTPFQATYGGGGDAFIAKFSNTGTPIWSTFYGGSGSDRALGVTVDAFNNIIVTGQTTSTNFPTTPVGVPNALSYNQNAPTTGTDAFVLKFNSNGVRIWASCYGGGSADVGTSVVCDANGNIFIGGTTSSNNLPVTPAGFPLPSSYNQPSNAGGSDVFIVKFDNNGVRLWATYFGGNQNESIPTAPSTDTELGIDQCGNIYFVFETRSTNIPVLNPSGNACGYYDNSYGTGGTWAISDYFLTKFTNNGQLLYSTYIGGQGWDFGPVISLENNNNNFFIGGASAGVASGFPLMNPGSPAYFNSTIGVAKVSLHKFVPLIPTYALASNNSTGCACNGTASVSVTCGEAPFNYYWSTGLTVLSTTLNNSSIANLCPGVYQVTVVSGCTYSFSSGFTITPTNTMLVNASVQNANCTSPTGSVIINSVTNGVPNYT